MCTHTDTHIGIDPHVHTCLDTHTLIGTQPHTHRHAYTEFSGHTDLLYVWDALLCLAGSFVA